MPDKYKTFLPRLRAAVPPGPEYEMEMQRQDMLRRQQHPIKAGMEDFSRGFLGFDSMANDTPENRTSKWSGLGESLSLLGGAGVLKRFGQGRGLAKSNRVLHGSSPLPPQHYAQMPPEFTPVGMEPRRPPLPMQEQWRKLQLQGSGPR